MAICGEYREGAKDHCYHCGHHRHEQEFMEKHVPLEQRLEDMVSRLRSCEVRLGKELLVVRPPKGMHPRELARKLVEILDRPRILR